MSVLIWARCFKLASVIGVAHGSGATLLWFETPHGFLHQLDAQLDSQEFIDVQHADRGAADCG